MLYQLSHVRMPALEPAPAGTCPACEQNCSRSWPLRKLGPADWDAAVSRYARARGISDQKIHVDRGLAGTSMPR